MADVDGLTFGSAHLRVRHRSGAAAASRVLGMATGGVSKDGWDHLRNVPQQARAQRSVDQVLAAASAILVSEPENLTMSEVGRRSGVSKGTVYRYFPDMASIVQTLAMPYVDMAVDRTAEVLSGIDDPITAALLINQLLDEVISFLGRDPVANAVFITAYNRLYIGHLFNDGVVAVANCAIEHIGHILNDEVEAHPRVAALGIHLARSLIDLTTGMKKKERDSLVNEYRKMMFRAADVNFNRPAAMELPDTPLGLEG